MNARNHRISSLIALLAVACLAGCEPSGWFTRDLGAPGPPDTAPVFAKGSVKGFDATDFERLESDLRTVAEAARDLEFDDIETPTPAAEETPAVTEEADPLAAEEYQPTGPSPEFLAMLEDPALADTPEDRLALALAREVVALRSDVERLRQQMEAQMGSFVRNLKFENTRLRREVQRLYAAAGQEGVSLPVLPGSGFYGGGEESWPGDTSVESGGDPTASSAPYPSDDFVAEAPAGAGPVAVVGSSTSSYAVLVEWGRSPEEAVNVGPDVSSLRGMIVLVPPGTDSNSLEHLGRQLRAEYAAYDNINITVFDNSDAADAYAKTNSQENGKPVMRVSKFAARGEDRITIYQGDEVIEIPAGP